MLIAGIDVSKTHYAMVVREPLPKGKYRTDYMFASTTKGLVEQAIRKGYQAHYLPDYTQWKKKVNDNPHNYTMFLCDVMAEFIEEDLGYIGLGHLNCFERYIAFEGYSFASPGQLLQIAEVTSAIKQIFYQDHWNIRIHDPLTVKLWATGDGKSEKELLRVEAVKDGLQIPVFIFDHSMCYDICDAYFLMKILETELQVREKPMLLNELNDNQKRVFNRVTQAYKTNLLDRAFSTYKDITEFL